MGVSQIEFSGPDFHINMHMFVTLNTAQSGACLLNSKHYCVWQAYSQVNVHSSDQECFVQETQDFLSSSKHLHTRQQLMFPRSPHIYLMDQKVAGICQLFTQAQLLEYE